MFASGRTSCAVAVAKRASATTASGARNLSLHSSSSSYAVVASSARFGHRVVAFSKLGRNGAASSKQQQLQLQQRRTFASSSSAKEETKKKTWWTSAELWGGLGALAGWGMSGSAIYDAAMQGPEVISLTMTPVLIVYSTLFARWAFIVKPQNLLLCSCHVANVIAQVNQLRRALEYKIECGQRDEVEEMGRKAAMGGAVIAGSVLVGPTMRSYLANKDWGVVSTVAAADAGPFTVHFWAPMSKWFISGASFMDLNRPTDKVSLPQYTALTLTGFFFSRYSLLVIPINYTLCSVNIALFLSSAWHLGRKLNADYFKFGLGQSKEE